MGDHVILKDATPVPLSFLIPRALELLISLNNGKRRSSIGDAAYTPYAFVIYNTRGDNWEAAKHLTGSLGKAKRKSFASDKAAAEHAAEEALRVGPRCRVTWVHVTW
jgi:hypothetical protein